MANVDRMHKVPFDQWLERLRRYRKITSSLMPVAREYWFNNRSPQFAHELMKNLRRSRGIDKNGRKAP